MGQVFLWCPYSQCLMIYIKDIIGLEIDAWVTPSIFGFAGRFCRAECAETEVLGTDCTANQRMKPHWKPLAGFLLCALAPNPCNANTASIPWTDRDPLSASTTLAYLPLVAKSSLLAAGTKEGKELNVDEVINPSRQARLVKDNGRADCTCLESCCPSSWPGKGSTSSLRAAQNAVTGLRVRMSLARTSKVGYCISNTFTFDILLRNTWTNWQRVLLVYMFPYSHYIKLICKKGLLSIPGKKKKKKVFTFFRSDPW